MIDLWYKNAIIYCLDVGTFADGRRRRRRATSAGLCDHLPYLAGIGITCVWLLPFYPSPRRDDGYDIQDYYSVDPRFGTLGDFVDFMRQADELGIRVIVDLVVNHTSDQHPWFKSARSDPELAISRLVRLVQTQAEGRRQRHRVSRRSEDDLDLDKRAQPTTSIASTSSSPT